MCMQVIHNQVLKLKSRTDLRPRNAMNNTEIGIVHNIAIGHSHSRLPCPTIRTKVSQEPQIIIGWVVSSNDLGNPWEKRVQTVEAVRRYMAPILYRCSLK